MNAAVDLRIDPVAKHIRGMIDAYGEAWGYQWRHNFGRGVRIEIPSLLGRFMTEGFAATEGQHKPRRYPEVFLGMGLDFARAVAAQPERHREIAFAHYVIQAHVTRKATALNISYPTYYQRLDAMRLVVAREILGAEDAELIANIDSSI
jgi:hypothetical protein